MTGLMTFEQGVRRVYQLVYKSQPSRVGQVVVKFHKYFIHGRESHLNIYSIYDVIVYYSKVWSSTLETRSTKSRQPSQPFSKT